MAAAAIAAVAACGPTGTTDEARPIESTPERESISSLRIYQELGFVAGDGDFPAVGHFVFLPGPADSSYAIFALSLSNSTLRFRRDQPGFVARYRVSIAVGDTAAPVAWLDQTEVVRVSSFRETSRRDESVVFQGYLKLFPGEYPATVVVRDLASSSGFEAGIAIEVPHFDDTFITSPVIVYRAEPRLSRTVPPSLIVNPRATVDLSGGQSHLYVESGASVDDPAVIEIVEEGQVISTDTLTFRPQVGPLRTVSKPLDVSELSPGALQLRVRQSGPLQGDSTTLVVALMPGWIVLDYPAAMSHLRYAGTPAQLDSLASALPGERAQLLHAFWNRKDTVPETPENEFFERYFRRMNDANDRFAEATTPGWLTDRGSVYIVFGPPDQVLRQVEAGQGPERSQVWLYDESLDFELRLVFYDPTATGAYSLTVESRRAFFGAIQTLYS